jgi:hypothetical protein
MSASAIIDRSGSPFCVHPLEKHAFVGEDFDCSFCHRPRALHTHNGFTPVRQAPGFIEHQTLEIEREFGCSKPRPRNRAMGFKGEDSRTRKITGQRRHGPPAGNRQ